MPETTHMLMWAMSDRKLPRSLRMMEGFGVYTFKLVNAKGKASFVKFHWRPTLGIQSTIWDEALKLQAADTQRVCIMQTMVPTGRANYEPHSLAGHGEDGGPRETPAGLTTAYLASGADETGDKLRIRADTFADHYSHV